MNKKVKRSDHIGRARIMATRSLSKAFELAKGVTAESRTLEVLNRLKPGWLREAVAASQKENLSGIDIVLHLNDGQTVVPLQVKSSERGLHGHIQKRREIKGRFVPCVIIGHWIKDEEIVGRVAEALILYKKGKDLYKKREKRERLKRERG